MKLLFKTITIIALFTTNIAAQDVITMKNGTELTTRVTEVTTDLIKYKKYDNLNGPTYSVNKVEVFMIKYENGSKDVFSSDQKSIATPRTSNTTPSDDESVSNSSDSPKGSFNINPLGLLQFGPIIQYEAKIGERAYIAPHFRYAFAGVLTHLVWTEFDEDSELDPSTAAIGLGIKGFTETTRNSLYYAGVLDLGWATARYDVGESYASEQKATTLSIMSNIGYRWRSSRSSHVNLGLIAGVAMDLKDEERSLEGSIIDSNEETIFLAMLELSFGWEYK